MGAPLFSSMVSAHLWKQAPFLRLIFPLVAGIIFQWHAHLSLNANLFSISVCLVPVLLYFFFSPVEKYRLAEAIGLFIHLLVFFLGALLIHGKERHLNKITITQQENIYL